MRVVATSDTHHPVDLNFIPDGDVFIHAGDLMQTGYPSDFERQLRWLRKLPHAIKLYTPGNHDFHLQVYPGPALQQLRDAGVWVIGLPGNTNYESYVLPNGMRVTGFPFVRNLPRWAFNSPESDILEALERSREFNDTFGPPDIVVSHTPPYGILDEKSPGEHFGYQGYTDYLENYYRRPKHWICGHIHEAYGTTEKYETDYYIEKTGVHHKHVTKFYNVAMCNRKQEQVNPPMVIDL